MTKEERIQDAYLKLGLPFNQNIVFDNGWLKIKPGLYSSKYDDLHLLKLTSSVHSIRPKSLQGIESNNDWIKIKSEEDLPEQGGSYYVTRYGKVETAVYIKDNRWLVKGNDYPKTTNLHSITHYQPIEKPKPPLY